MSEWKRIFLNRIWLGTAALSLLFSLVIYATAQSSRVGSSVLAYREHTNQWTQILSVVSPEDGLALLERENQTLQGWNTARMLVQLEEWQGQIDEEILNRYREQYENLDEMLHAVRSETAPELDIAAQESVARWIDRLVYQMGYAEFVQSVSTQAAAIRRSPMFSDSNTFVYRNADRTEADYLSTTEIHLKLLPCDVIESVLENHVAMVFSLFLMMVTIALIVEPKRLGLEALEQSCASGSGRMEDWCSRCVRGCDYSVDAGRNVFAGDAALPTADSVKRSCAIHTASPALGSSNYGRSLLTLVFIIQCGRTLGHRTTTVAGSVSDAISSSRANPMRRNFIPRVQLDSAVWGKRCSVSSVWL